MPGQLSSFTTEQKLELLVWQSIQQGKQLMEIQEALVSVSSEQADFNADITALSGFLSGLPAQLTAIQAALADRGITDVTELDSLVTEANNIAPTLANLPGGTPPATPAPGGSTPA